MRKRRSDLGWYSNGEPNLLSRLAGRGRSRSVQRWSLPQPATATALRYGRACQVSQSRGHRGQPRGGVSVRAAPRPEPGSSVDGVSVGPATTLRFVCLTVRSVRVVRARHTFRHVYRPHILVMLVNSERSLQMEWI